jgi:hypothetical protein
MRLGPAAILLLLGGTARADVEPPLRCPTNLLDIKTQLTDTKDGVDVTVLGGDARKILEIRKRTTQVVNAVRAGIADLADLQGCGYVIKNAKVTAQDVVFGARLSIRADKPADVKALQEANHKRQQEEAASMAKPHAIMLVDAKTTSEVWIDDIDSGYQTPTDPIYLPPGQHAVAVQPLPEGKRGVPTTVVIPQNEVRRLYFPPAK